MKSNTLQAKLRDTAGASIVIALVFFLICAIIGSVVLTAASVQAKAVQTHRELQQAEYTVGSAAQTMGEQFASISATLGEDGQLVLPDTVLSFAKSFWGEYGADILAQQRGEKDFAPKSMQLSYVQSEKETKPVYGEIGVDADLKVTIKLSLDPSFSKDSPYNMTVFLQCIPTYNVSGKLVAFTYEQAVVSKDSV